MKYCSLLFKDACSHTQTHICTTLVFLYITTLCTSFHAVPPKPRNIRVVNQTENETTIAWDPVNDLCSFVEYNISTTNCGSCPSVVNGYNLTCRTPEQRQQCNISVRAVTQCAMSESESETFTVPGIINGCVTIAYEAMIPNKLL